VQGQGEWSPSTRRHVPSEVILSSQAGDVRLFSVANDVSMPPDETAERGRPEELCNVDRNGNPVVKITFPTTTCAVRHDCTRATRDGRELTVRTEEAHTALQTARRDQATPGFWELYKVHAGVEGTLSQALRRCDLRQARYRGLAKTRLQHLLIPTALNVIRVVAWLAETPFTRTRRSRFAAFAPPRSDNRSH
jgi:hypothetical protein